MAKFNQSMQSTSLSFYDQSSAYIKPGGKLVNVEMLFSLIFDEYLRIWSVVVFFST